MAVPVRLLLALAPALLACGGDTGSALSGAHDGPPGTPDAPAISSDAAPGAPDAGTPDAGAPATARFTLAVVPDTQYLFDQDRGNPEVLATSLRWIVDHAARESIAFSASLGDIVENAGAGELAEASAVYPDEPQATLAVPPGGGLQWAVWPTGAPGILTSWSHAIPPGSPWLHVALINDGRHTTMYVDGAPVLRNPRAANIGLATTGQPWMIAANHYGNVVEQTFHGWLGDVRIVDRPLPRAAWMLRSP